jgi:hypothetical protein
MRYFIKKIMFVTAMGGVAVAQGYEHDSLSLSIAEGLSSSGLRRENSEVICAVAGAVVGGAPDLDDAKEEEVAPLLSPLVDAGVHSGVAAPTAIMAPDARGGAGTVSMADIAIGSSSPSDVILLPLAGGAEVLTSISVSEASAAGGVIVSADDGYISGSDSSSSSSSSSSGSSLSTVHRRTPPLLLVSSPPADTGAHGGAGAAIGVVESPMPFALETVVGVDEGHPVNMSGAPLWWGKYCEFMGRVPTGQTSTNGAILRSLSAAAEPLRDRVALDKIEHRRKLGYFLGSAQWYLARVGYRAPRLPAGGDIPLDTLEAIKNAANTAILYVNGRGRTEVPPESKDAVILMLGELKQTAITLGMFNHTLPLPDVSIGDYVKALIHWKHTSAYKRYFHRISFSMHAPYCSVFGGDLAGYLPAEIKVPQTVLSAPYTTYEQWIETEKLMATRGVRYSMVDMELLKLIPTAAKSAESVAYEAWLYSALKNLVGAIIAVRPVIADLLIFNGMDRS